MSIQTDRIYNVFIDFREGKGFERWLLTFDVNKHIRLSVPSVAYYRSDAIWFQSRYKLYHPSHEEVEAFKMIYPESINLWDCRTWEEATEIVYKKWEKL